jgi:peptide/nickel transport system substrate-binding protein
MTDLRDDHQHQMLNLRMHRRYFLGGALALGATSLLTACGGEDATNTPAQEQPTATAPPAAPPTATEVPAATAAPAATDATPTMAAVAATPTPAQAQRFEILEFDDPEPGPPVGNKPEELVIAWGLTQLTTHGVDPQLHCGAIAESQLRNIFEPLVGWAPDLQTIVPILATEWERLDDLTMQFKLRQGVKFHNGEDFNAEAVRYSVLRPLSDETPGDCRSIWTTIDGVDIVDEYTVNIRTKNPDPAFLPRMAGIHMNMVAPEWASQGPEAVAREALGGTGPYKFVSWSPNEDLVIEANEDYWGQVPSIKRVRMTTIREQSTRVAALRAGDVHIAKDIPVEEIASINADARARVLRTIQARVPFYFITVDVEPYNDPRVRQAINYAANVQGVIDAVILGHGQRVSTVMATWDFAFDDTLLPYTHDPDKARELLAEAGYPNGIDINIWYIQGRYPKDKEVAEAMAQEMSRAGIRCTPQLQEAAVLTELQRAKECPGLIFASWGNIWFDPDYSLVPLFGCEQANQFMDWRRPYGCNEALESILQEARVELDIDRRRELYHQAQRFIYDDAAALFMYQLVDTWGVNNWVKWTPRGDEQAWAYDMEWNE